MERAFLVYEKNLYELLAHSPRCGIPVDRYTIGTGTITFKNYCTCSGDCDTDGGQPLVENLKGLGNLFVTTSIGFSGILIAKFQRFTYFLNLKSITDTLFYRLRRDVVFLVVIRKWKQWCKRLLQLLKQQEKVILVGDGTCDSPGHSAKYCTYTFMEASTGNVLDPLQRSAILMQWKKRGSRG